MQLHYLTKCPDQLLLCNLRYFFLQIARSGNFFKSLQVHEFSIKNHAKIGHLCPIFVYFNKTIYIKAGLQ
jgi:hypothetical protein